MREFRYSYDKEADAIYVYLNDVPYSYTLELDDVRNIDYAEDDTPIGIELLCVSSGVNIMDLPSAETVERIIEVLDRERIKVLV